MNPTNFRNGTQPTRRTERATRTAMTILVALAAGPIGTAAADWVTAPSFHTHDPATGMRVVQAAARQPAIASLASQAPRATYRHYESTLSVGGVRDRIHVVDQSGPSVRPYGEWQHPYRPYSVPYAQWGFTPFAGTTPWTSGPPAGTVSPGNPGWMAGAP